MNTKMRENNTKDIFLELLALASIYSYFIFAETISIKEIVGIIVVMAGVYLVKMQYHKKSVCCWNKAQVSEMK